MTEDKHDCEELTAPAATAKKLHISVATLRKYSLVVEKATGKRDYYARTKQNARLYSKQDVQDLADFHRLARENGLTLHEAAQQIFASKNKSGQKDMQDGGQKQEKMTQEQMIKLLHTLERTVAQQNIALANLQKQLNRIEEQNKGLLTKQKQVDKSATSKKLKAKDFADLPDISGIVTKDEKNISSVKDTTNDVPARPLTTAEKRAQLKRDENKTSKQVHEEILAKAKENAQKNPNSNAHRTLKDMQVEPEETHWWQRFLDN